MESSGEEIQSESLLFLHQPAANPNTPKFFPKQCEVAWGHLERSEAAVLPTPCQSLSISTRKIHFAKNQLKPPNNGNNCPFFFPPPPQTFFPLNSPEQDRS